MRSINLIAIHCSATPNGVAVTPAQIDKWHAQRGFNRTEAGLRAQYGNTIPPQALRHIGYHWVITAEGRTEIGRTLDEPGAHVAGHNANSIGICMVGTDRFYLHQWMALRDLLCTLAYSLQERLPVPQQIKYRPSPELAVAVFARLGIRVVGHRDLSPDANGDGKIDSRDWLKTCPGFSVADWLANGMLPTKGNLFAPGVVTNPDPVARVGGAL